MQNSASNIDGAIRFVIDAGQKHPNRIDICNQNSLPGGTRGEFAVGKRPISSVQSGNNAFGAPAQQAQPNPFGGGGAASTPFGQPSALGQRANPFGTPAFGQPSQPTSAFGKPSQPTTAFGQPSQPTSAFGQPSQMGGGGASAFGQPSALGQRANPFGTPAFGQPAQPSGGNAFGQPSALGQKPNPFATQASNPNPFGQGPGVNATPASNPFGQNPQGDNTQPNPFGQPSRPTPQPPNPNPFGQPAGQPAGQAAPNPFGQPSQPQANAPNPFAQNAPLTKGFASSSMDTSVTNHSQATSVNSFQQTQNSGGLSSAATTNLGMQNPLSAGTTSGSGPYPPESSKQHPPAESYSSRGPGGRLTMWKGKPVTYKGDLPGIRNFDGSWNRIWCPDGPPGYYKDTEMPKEDYDQKAMVQWEPFLQAGQFKEGVMPDLPPQREFCLWDI
jgi:nucleoporin NUP42